MRAAVFDRYGAPEVVRMVEVPRPAVGRGEVLVRVLATAVTAADSRIRGSRFPEGFTPFARLAFGVVRPRRRILGSCFSGVVEAVDPGTSDVRPGDEVAGMSGAAFGAHAEYVAIRAGRVVAKPASVTHTDAAGVLFGGTTALYFLRDRATVTAGRSVLVIGASGAIGTNAVQLAKNFGATVTAVTSSANASLVAGLGADHVIDYAIDDVTVFGKQFDVVLDAVGVLSPRSGRRLLRSDGTLLLAAANLWETLQARGQVKSGVTPERPADFAYLLRLVEAGQLRVVHDRVTGDGAAADISTADIVTAHRRVDSGRKVGNIVLTF